MKTMKVMKTMKMLKAFGKTSSFAKMPFFTLSLLFILCPLLPAQNSTRTRAPFLVPQTIFVGDSGRLVVPLGRAFAEVNPFVWENSEKLPQKPDLTIKRIELERRGDASQLLIDFIPYTPGRISIPPLEFSSLGTALPTLSGLEVQVASILNPSQMYLSGPAPPLAVPGTSVLVYGTVVLIIFLLSVGIAVSVWSRKHAGEVWQRMRRRRLLKGMGKFLKKLNQECALEKNVDAALCLSRLSAEFRVFLSLFSGINCRSLTAGEFLNLSPGSGLVPDHLGGLFHNWDTLRFSGFGVEMDDLFHALGETEKLIGALDRAEKEKSLLEREAV